MIPMKHLSFQWTMACSLGFKFWVVGFFLQILGERPELVYLFHVFNVDIPFLQLEFLDFGKR